MIDEYTVRFLNAIAPVLSGVSPSLYVGSLLGIINTCVFYLFLGRGLKLFPAFLAVGIAGALVGVAVGGQVSAWGPLLGEVHLVAASLSTWAFLFVARSLRL